jgi:hypothetical protein
VNKVNLATEKATSKLTHRFKRSGISLWGFFGSFLKMAAWNLIRAKIKEED